MSETERILLVERQGPIAYEPSHGCGGSSVYATVGRGQGSGGAGVRARRSGSDAR